MSTPTEEVSKEKEEVSTDLKSTIEEVSTHLKKSNYKDWIPIVTELLECLCDFCDQHFPSTTQRKISEIEHQIDLCIEVLDSIPQEGSRASSPECCSALSASCAFNLARLGMGAGSV
ncbi:hypothetical protein MTR67_007928 [Solanum verrucosum]|uniref:Uncharacterized protein n=1 Tax=Solanum verrucosum TaxID=315347 RepID=A0AAF0TFZ5_SOLVR|nr:hypothetical protein MTR67_007928 [Solanum verrucosum]